MDALACSPLLQACLPAEQGALQRLASPAVRSVLAAAMTATAQLQALAGPAEQDCQQRSTQLPALHYLSREQALAAVAQLHAAAAQQGAAAGEQLAAALLLHPRPEVRQGALEALAGPGGECSPLLHSSRMQTLLVLHGLADSSAALRPLAARVLCAAAVQGQQHAASMLPLLPLVVCRQQDPTVCEHLDPCVQQLLAELRQLPQQAPQPQPAGWRHLAHAARLLYSSSPQLRTQGAATLERLLGREAGSLSAAAAVVQPASTAGSFSRCSMCAPAVPQEPHLAWGLSGAACAGLH